MRKIIVYIATSADGFIARKDGAVDWLDRPRIKGNYGMGEFYKSIDTILWGRKTYEMVLRFQKEGKEAPDMSGIKNYAFSHKPPRKVARGFEFVKQPIKEFAKSLRAEKGKDRNRTVPLKLLSSKKFSDGVMRLHYEVMKEKPKKAAKKIVSEARP